MIMNVFVLVRLLHYLLVDRHAAGTIGLPDEFETLEVGGVVEGEDDSLADIMEERGLSIDDIEAHAYEICERLRVGGLDSPVALANYIQALNLLTDVRGIRYGIR